MHYEGKLADGTVFASSYSPPAPLVVKVCDMRMGCSKLQPHSCLRCNCRRCMEAPTRPPACLLPATCASFFPPGLCDPCMLQLGAGEAPKASSGGAECVVHLAQLRLLLHYLLASQPGQLHA